MTRVWGQRERWDAARRFAALYPDVGAEIRGPLSSVGPRDVADALVRTGWTAASFSAELTPNQRGPASNGPYDDPSRDVGEGPDGMTRTQSWLVAVAVLVGIYVGSASCGTAVQEPVEHRCHICQEFTSGGNP